MRSANIEEGKWYYWMNQGVLELVKREDGYFVKRDGSIANVKTENHIVPLSERWYRKNVKPTKKRKNEFV